MNRTVISETDPKRCGKILVMSAILMPVAMGLVALAVDTGVIATARAQLKTVADSAALAGAMQLVSDRRISSTIADLTPEMNAARAKAIEIGQANRVLNQAAMLVDNPSNSADGDMVIGYKKTTAPNPDSPEAPVDTAAPFTQYNSVQVLAQRSGDRVGVVPAFFSRIFGSSGSTLRVTSTATVDLYQIQGFSNNGTANSRLLPIAFNRSFYQDQIINGKGGDRYTFSESAYNPPSSTGVSNGPDGVKESVVYPVPSGYPGNWGTIDIGVNNSNNSTADLNDQILNGIPPGDLTDISGNPIDLELRPGGQWFQADTGISAGIKHSLEQIIGMAVTVPLYDITNGRSGNNLEYRIVGFAPARLVAVNFQGNNKYVIIQPAIVQDPNAIPDTDNPASWTQGGVVRLHLSR